MDFRVILAYLTLCFLLVLRILKLTTFKAEAMTANQPFGDPVVIIIQLIAVHTERLLKLSELLLFEGSFLGFQWNL